MDNQILEILKELKKGQQEIKKVDIKLDIKLDNIHAKIVNEPCK